MSRRSIVKKRYPTPDPTYNSLLVSLLTARILKRGKKRLADKIISETFALVAEKTTEDPIQIFEKAVKSVDIIYHLASQTSVYEAEKNPLADYEANVRPMQLLLEACRTEKNCPVIILLG